MSSKNHMPGEIMSFRFIAAIAALGGLLFGYDTGVISGALLFIRDEMHLSASMQGIVVGIALAGAALGAAAAGFLSALVGLRHLTRQPLSKGA